MNNENVWTIPFPETLRERLKYRKFGRKLKNLMRDQPPRPPSLYDLLHQLKNSQNISSRWREQFNWFERENPQPDSGPYQDFKIQFDCLRAARR